MRHILLPVLCFALAPHAHALTDTNANGLSDDWEKSFNGGQLFSAANPDHIPTADPDGDGWTNLQEATAGTDPFHSLPPSGVVMPSIAITPATYEPLPVGSVLPLSTEPTDPLAPAPPVPPSSPRILLDPAEIRLTWQPIPGKTYRALLSPDLLAWSPASGTYVGGNDPITYETVPLHEDGTMPEKLFWRVETGDTDTDGDTISDYEEILRNLKPLSADTDGDGLPDNTDPAPLVNSLQAVWDADSVDPSAAPLFAAFNFTPPAAGGYPFTAERVTDMSENNRHGKARTQFQTTPPVQSAPQDNAEGIANHGFRFANAHHFAFDLINPGINFAPVTSLSFWLKTKAADLEGNGQPVFSYVPKLGVFAQNPNSANPYAARAFLRKQPVGTGYEVVWLDWTFPGNIVRERWTLDLTAPQLEERWINLTFVWQGGSGASQSSYWACYANGVKQIRTLGSTYRFQTTPTTPNTPQDTFVIGADAAGGSGQSNLATIQSTFKGAMDRVRIYTAALTPAQILAIVQQDTDNDGLWDTTEAAATAWKDTNGNGRRDIGEIFYPNGSPLIWQHSGTDSDSDGITDILEQNATRTDPYNHDSDNDLLPDGWETQYNLNPNSSTGIDGQTGDPDNDGVDNFREWQHLTNPRLADSDGDTINDATEIGQGSDPNSGGDNGQAPPPEETLTLKIIVGDPSDSHSERWRVEATEVESGHLILRHASRQYGQVTTAAESTFNKFKPGKAYSFQLIHAGTDPVKLATDPERITFPDYDWTLQISYKNADGSFTNVTEPAQTRYLLLDPYNNDTKSLSEDSPNLLAPEDPWGSIGDGQDARPAYYEKIEPMRVVILPVSAVAVSRDPDDGAITELGSLAETSDPAPQVTIDTLTAAITAGGGLSINYSGTARDRLSEIMHDPTRGITRIDVYLDGVFLKSLAGFQNAPGGAAIRSPWVRRDSTIAFSDTITVPDAAPGLRQITLVTNANAAGNKGFHSGSILIEKQTHAGITLADPPSFQLTLPAAFGTAADSLTLQHAGNTHTLTEEAASPVSAFFVGNVTLGGTAKALGLQLPENLTLSANSPDTFVGEAIWDNGSGGLNRIQAVWTETGNSTHVFSQISTLATVDSWQNLRIAGTALAAPSNPGTFNPFVIRMETPESIEAFGKKGLFTAEWDSAAATFRKPHRNIGEAPPAGLAWHYLSRGIEPRVFCLHPSLAGSPHSPGDIIGENGIHLRFRPKHDPSKEFKSSIKPIDVIPAPPGSPPVAGLLAAAAPAPAYSMAEVRLWFELLFDTAGKDLLDRLSNGTSSDRGVAISLQQLWATDKRPYKFQKTEPRYQDTGGSGERASLWINTRVCKTPVDASVALYHALQELRNKDALWLRSGLVIDWTEVLNTYLQSTASDAEIEKALREAKLGPLLGTVTAAKDAYALGFSFVPGGDAIVTSVDVENQLVQGNVGGAALVGSALLAPRLLKIMARYAGKTLKRWRWNLGDLGNIEWNAAQLDIIENPVIFSLTASRADRMAALAPAIRAGTITDVQVIKLYEMGVLKLRSGTSRSTLRKAMLAAGQDGKGKIAHHMLPIAAKNPELELKFLQRGIDPNDAENGLFLTQTKHDLVHGKGATGWGFGDPYLHQWYEFFEENPAADFQAVIDFREQLKAIISQEYKHADDIPWPIPK